MSLCREGKREHDERYFLSLKGLQFGVNEQTEELETITPADYYLRNGSHYVVYDELLEGCEETIKT